MKERNRFLFIITAFLACWYLPIEQLPFRNPIFEALALVKWYTREHVLLCLVPAFFIAGAISLFVSQGAVIKYFWAKAKKILAYSIASISGSILAVCSCTVLPLFSGIYKRGAGLGPALALLLAGPALSLPNMLVIRGVIGTKKTLIYVSIVVIMATLSGIIFGVII